MEEQEIGFQELMATIRTVNSKDRTMKLGDCIEFELKDLMSKINEYNKGGKIAIELFIDVAEKNELNIQANIKTTKPKGKKPSNPLYRDSKGSLYLDDPNQLKLIDTRKVQELHNKGAANE